MSLKAIRWGAVGLAGIAAGSVLYGKTRWARSTRLLHERMDAVRKKSAPQTYEPGELDGLPVPVQRYFRAALSSGQPLVSAASVRHSGTFNMSDSGENWKPFVSSQRVVTRRPGFVWNARVFMAPGLAIHVHDAYVAGEGILCASLFGLAKVMDATAQPGVAEGELMRFVAETAWYPTALLPSQGVRWKSVDDRSALATLEDGGNRVTMRFRFAESGLIDTVGADHRGRMVNGVAVPTPWQGRFWNYETREGMLVPLDGEVAWLLPEGPHPYWRGHIERIHYVLTR